MEVRPEPLKADDPPLELRVDGKNSSYLKTYSSVTFGSVPGNPTWVFRLKAQSKRRRKSRNRPLLWQSIGGSRVKTDRAYLDGEWLAKAEKSFPTSDPAAWRSIRKFRQSPLRNKTGRLIFTNGMIYPLLPFSVKGAIWYQGESNSGRASRYRTTFPHLIEGWRKNWPDLPFYFCQPANNRPKTDQPVEGTWPELREAQACTLSLPHTGMAVLIDLGEADDIHPRNKRM